MAAWRRHATSVRMWPVMTRWYFGRPVFRRVPVDGRSRSRPRGAGAAGADRPRLGVGFYHRQSRDSLVAIYLDHHLEGFAHCRPGGTSKAKLYQHLDVTLDHAKPGQPPHASVWCRPMCATALGSRPACLSCSANAYLLAPYPEAGRCRWAGKRCASDCCLSDRRG